MMLTHFILFPITLHFLIKMAKNYIEERKKRRSQYDYEINLLISGMKSSDVLILSQNMGNNLSLRTINTPFER